TWPVCTATTQRRRPCCPSLAPVACQRRPANWRVATPWPGHGTSGPTRWPDWLTHASRVQEGQHAARPSRICGCCQVATLPRVPHPLWGLQNDCVQFYETLENAVRRCHRCHL